MVASTMPLPPRLDRELTLASLLLDDRPAFFSIYRKVMSLADDAQVEHLSVGEMLREILQKEDASSVCSASPKTQGTEDRPCERQ